MLPLIHALQDRATVEILVTTGTVTSAERLTAVLPAGARHQYVPVDTAGAVQRFLDHWRPDLAIWVESELWPRLVVETAARGCPMALVNARLSARSHARWRRAAAMARALFRRFNLILAQDTETVARLADLDVNASFAGNLKALVEMPPPARPSLEVMQGALAGRTVWLAASTHEGEEGPVLQAHKTLLSETDTLLILAPRHPERADEVAALVRETGLSLARRSVGDLPTERTQVYLADTLGEMALWYTLAPVTFVAGSFKPRGGHTPFEPIACGSAVIHGPHVENFAPAYAALEEAGGAMEVRDDVDLAAKLRTLMTDEAVRATMVESANAAHALLRPDVGAMADELLALMEAGR